MINLIDVILDKIGWIADPLDGWEIKIHWA